MPKISTGFAVAVIIVILLFLGVSLWIMYGQHPSMPLQTSPRGAHGGDNIQQQEQEKNRNNGNNPSDLYVDTLEVSYENKEYGFVLGLPEQWSAYSTRIKKESDAASIDILVPTHDPQWRGSNANMVVINIEKESSWDVKKNSSECQHPIPGCPSENVVLGRTNGFIVYMTPPQDIPMDVWFPNDYMGYFRERFVVK